MNYVTPEGLHLIAARMENAAEASIKCASQAFCAEAAQPHLDAASQLRLAGSVFRMVANDLQRAQIMITALAPQKT